MNFFLEIASFGPPFPPLKKSHLFLNFYLTSFWAAYSKDYELDGGRKKRLDAVREATAI